MYRCVAHRSVFRIATCLIICAALLPVPTISFVATGDAQGQGTSAERKGRPRPEKPEGELPNVEDINNESHLKREPFPPIHSTLRSPKNEGKPWDGRRVGDQSPDLDQANNRTPRGSKRWNMSRSNQTRRAHAWRPVSPPPPVSDIQFVQNFFTWTLARNPSNDESIYWHDQLRVGYAQSQESLKLAAIEFGRTLFESAPYAARNRDPHWYVYDLYKTYLMRDPDAGGWAMWEATVASHGREYVRRGFEESTEFATLLSTFAPSSSPTANASSLISARVDRRNQPGNGMLARDVNWAVPLLSVPGRAGLDLGLALSYSSQVWTRSGPYIYFDEDNGFPSPGFRLGFPTVQRKVFDAQTAKNAYLLITGTGRRVELRHVSSNIYDAADSSYLRLTDNGPTLLVHSTDGTRMSFSESNGEFRCVEVKDRNGNYITINYNSLGRITTITDTLTRVITFNYDGNANLISITQAWNGQPSHQWASFGWGSRSMQSSFSQGFVVVGPVNGASLPVVTQVNLNDTSHYTFDYTNSLQLLNVKNYFGAVERNAATFTYDAPGNDVPRLLSSSISARNWTGYNNVPSQVTTNYSVAGGACVMTAPDGTIYKEYYGAGWQKGLTTLSEVWSAGVRQKWTTTTWTQDNTSVGYETNPRVTESVVNDASTNQRRTTIDYGTYWQYGLPYTTREYAANGTTVLRETVTDYNLSQAYLDRRLIGLISEVRLTNGSQSQSKTTYSYDDPARLHGVPAAATQHDVNYNLSLTARGNVTAVSRWDVTDINNAAKKLTSYTNYYNTGTPISTTDPAGHQSSITYADSFSDTINRNTFAYPTTTTDEGNFNSYIQYNFDFGATTRTQSPAPANQSQGAIQTMTYNNLGQLERITTTNNGAYKRFWYGVDYTASYATVNNATDESYSIQVTDGMGRVIGAVNNHPGSSGGYSLVNTVYNLMGRAWLISNPTEVNNSWVPSGDDSAGIHYTQQTYDWQGRPVVTTNPDLTTKEVSYAGCGCAGGQVVTLTDEGTIDAGVAKRRQQRIYSDVLGRTVKTEILNWQGGTVYSATVNTYNARDQLEQIRRYAGAEGSGNYQDTTMTYDGYGRLKTKHLPEQNSGTTTTWNYNADNTIQSTVDARGASSTYSYNSRHSVTAIVYAGGYGTTPNVSFTYDAAGNKTSMSDGLGSVNYAYDQLSRLTQETRLFSALNQSYGITSGYNLANQLTSVGTPFTSQQVLYTYDTAGRIDAVTASGYSDTSYQGFWPNWYPVTTQVPTFASNISQRAAGGVKQLTYGHGAQLNFNYNARLAPTSLQINNLAGQESYTSTFSYYNDGRIRLATDLTDNVFDRLYSYDQVSRYKEALTGNEARGGTTADGPYRHTYTYDAWGNTTSLTKRVWTLSPVTTNATYSNNRRTGWTYDANGFAFAHSDENMWYSSEHDAISRRTYFEPTLPYVGGLPAIELHYAYDGNSLPTKTTDTRRTENWETAQITTTTTTSYLLHSTALGGQVVADLNAQGNKTSGYVYLNGMLLATEVFSDWPTARWMIFWQHMNPVTGSTYTSNISAGFWGAGQVDPLGADAATPPEPDIFVEPPYLNAKVGEFWPLEIAGWDAGRTNEMEIGMAQYVDTRDMIMAREAWNRGERDRAQRIVAANPNVGIVASGPGAIYLAQQADFEENANGSFTFWGGNAARALGLVTSANTVARPRAPNAANASPAEQERFEAAYDDATERLRNNRDCAAAFGGLRKAFKALRGTTFSFSDIERPSRLPGNKWLPPDTGARTRGTNVEFNRYGNFMSVNGRLKFPFMTAPATDVNYFPVFMHGQFAFRQIHGDVPIASFLLLHELGHRAGTFAVDGIHGSGQLGKSLELQSKNNTKIFDACGFK